MKRRPEEKYLDGPAKWHRDRRATNLIRDAKRLQKMDEVWSPMSVGMIASVYHQGG